MRKHKLYLFIFGGVVILSIILFLSGIIKFEITSHAVKEDINKSSNETLKEEKLKCEKIKKSKKIICFAESLTISSGEIVNLNLNITSNKK